jgi:endothelin-converting enzyme
MNLAKVAASTDEENFNTMKLAYSACMNETAIQGLGAKPLVNLINQVADSFPVKDKYGSNDTVTEADATNLSDTVLLLEKWGVSTFEALGTGADDENPVCSKT